MRVILAAQAILFSAAVAAGCQPPRSSSAPVPPSAPAAPATPEDEARQIYSGRCSPCHGAQGAGDGVAAAALTPRPRNFREASWQSSVTDAQIETVIRLGGPSIGKSPLMPPNPDLVAKPAVVTALRVMIRAMH